MEQTGIVNRPRGFTASIRLALKIAGGSLRLLRKYPKLVLPLIPIFALVLLALFALVFTPSLVFSLVIVFSVAFSLMLSFAITGQMLAQIDRGESPSILEALSASATVRMIPRVFFVSAVWYGLVLILVAIEMAVRSLLSRISDNLADGILNFIFGTIADALRMAGFMLVAIMTFEDIGLRPAIGRLRTVTRNNYIAILGGLFLTKLVGGISFLVMMFIPESFALLFIVVAGLAWVFGMYLEQLFVTGLYLYETSPESRLLGILMRDFIGAELPPLPELPNLSEQPQF